MGLNLQQLLLEGKVRKPCVISTNVHPRWNESGSNNVYGLDLFGIAFVPGGQRLANGTSQELGEKSYNFADAGGGTTYTLYTLSHNNNGDIVVFGTSGYSDK